MTVPTVVLDTNIVVTGLRSKKGTAFRLLSLVGQGHFEICLSVPIVLEYETVLMDQLEQLHLTGADVDNFLDYFCSVGKRQEIHYLWRPFLKDPKDDLVLELAIAGSCEAIVTYN